MARKKSGERMVWALIAAAAGAVFLVQGLIGAPVVRVVNEGGLTLTRLRLAGAEGRLPDSIPPQSSADLVLNVRGEAAPRLLWTDQTGEQAVSVGYVESFGGYCVTVRLLSNGRVEVSSAVVDCFSWRRIL